MASFRTYAIVTGLFDVKSIRLQLNNIKKSDTCHDAIALQNVPVSSKLNAVFTLNLQVQFLAFKAHRKAIKLFGSDLIIPLPVSYGGICYLQRSVITDYQVP